MGSMGKSLVVAAATWTALWALAGAASLNDIPRDFAPVIPAQDFTKRVAMIPMRDGVKLHTIIYVPEGCAMARRC